MAALLLVGLICLAALQLVNLVRSAQFNEDMVAGSLYLLAQRLQQYPSSLRELTSRIDARIEVLPYAQAGLDGYQIERLRHGRPLVLNEPQKAVRLFHELDAQRYIKIELDTITELQAQTTISLLVEDWQRSGEAIERFLAQRQKQFGYPLQLVPFASLKISDSDLARLQYGEAVVRITIAGKEMEALMKLPGQDNVLRLGPIRAFNPYSWQALSMITLIGALLLGLGVYWVVSSFEMRLRKLEQATSRLAMGHLGARVASEGIDPVSRLGQAFNKMAEHIQRLIFIQREMVRAVSHELRTPVARIRFGVQIIEDSVENSFVQKQLKGIDNDIQELDELVDEILTYARLEEGGPTLDFQGANVAAIAEQVVNEAHPPKQITVHYIGEPVEHCLLAEVEPRYIHRAIQNLVGNAGRYANSKVRVSCSVSGETCRVDVEDDGPGVPEEHWEKVFAAFARLDDSRTRSSGGYGLGLSIVRRIAYWHGGRAMVTRSDTLGGARFSLIWPRRHPNVE
ncbi:MAG: hypothetical protein RL217_2035 [Pseudomonadota bacterium]